MSSHRLPLYKGALLNSRSNSLDWDSPSHKTGTVKRRPVSGECLDDNDELPHNSPEGRREGVKPSARISTLKDPPIMKPSKIPGLHLLKPHQHINFSSTPPPPPPPTKLQFSKSNSCRADTATLNPSRSVNNMRTSTTETKWLPLKRTKCNLKTLCKIPDQRGYRRMEEEEKEVSKLPDSCERLDQHAYFNEFGCKTGKFSDTDSGIASPLSPSSVYGFLGYNDKNEEGGAAAEAAVVKVIGRNGRTNGMCLRETVQIYTDWANHYLEKARSKKRVNSLAADCSDGVLLAEVIESVTCQKIPDINRKPKTPAQMLDNINLCLGVLKAQHVSGLESVSAQELRDGKLKAILALFFALSRHKQAAKQRAQQIQQNQLGEMTPNRYKAKNLPIYPKCSHNKGSLLCTTLTMKDIQQFHAKFYLKSKKMYQDNHKKIFLGVYKTLFLNKKCSSDLRPLIISGRNTVSEEKKKRMFNNFYLVKHYGETWRDDDKLNFFKEILDGICRDDQENNEDLCEIREDTDLFI